MPGDNLVLVRPSKALQQDILDYKREHIANHDTRIHGSCGLAHHDDFDEWLTLVLSLEKEQLRNGVHTSTYFTMRERDCKLIGCFKLHHSLTPYLEAFGGHIAYGIRPSERNKGYGKQQLQMILDFARSLHLSKVLIVCHKDNLASARTAMSCGGVLTDEVEENHILQQHYWITLKKDVFQEKHIS